MAGQSSKKQVASNLKILQEIYLIISSSFIIFLISHIYFNRPFNSKILFILTSIPSLVSLLIIEKFGRPKFDSKGLIIKKGQDLLQNGLVEYLFDIIYLTIIINLISIIFNSIKPFWGFIIIPIFASYKLYSIFIMGKQLLGFGSNTTSNTKGNTTTTNEPIKSKRQQKLESRGDKQKIRYR